MKKKLTEKEFKSIYTRVPRACVELVIIQKNKVLLTKRSIYPFKDFWHLPGVGVLFREKINDAIKRAGRKELGVKVIPQKFLDYSEYLHDGYRHDVSLVFKCKLSRNKKPKPLEQASEVKFFNKIPKKTVPAHRKFLKTHLKMF
mgnify:CR=1 FL=1